MPNLLRVPLESGGSVLVEIDEDPQAVVRVARGGAVAQATETLERGLDSVREAAHAVVGRLTDFPRQPNKITLELGLKLSGETGVFLAKTAGEASLTLTLEWDGQRPDALPVTRAVTANGTAANGTTANGTSANGTTANGTAAVVG
ncbi:CU044_2847 family protein [Streptomyces hesseae]|uniref:CU044_2847 family protein n=1 Tax=Streptomyces hesseae TaxID=3075519 RepID=A0ABU2SKW7_9ACTN|nr:CU044_2847 family protein [Streptomyces sp. DSM 40473]MDT0449633.1 CU044_2847 family protein [Streptomyces sp. DSM 40473]